MAASSHPLLASPAGMPIQTCRGAIQSAFASSIVGSRRTSRSRPLRATVPLPSEAVTHSRPKQPVGMARPFWFLTLFRSCQRVWSRDADDS